MHSRDVQLSLMQALLAAPGSAAGWEAFLSKLCDALHGSAAKFIAHSMASTDSVSANVSVTVRVDPSAVADYERYWCRHDPWRVAMSPRVRPGEVLLGDSLIEPARISRTAFHNEFAVPYDTTQCLAGILEASPRSISNISVNRGENARRFDEDDARLLRMLMPSLSRALEVHRRLSGAELMAAHSLAVLDRLRDGVLLIAKSGRVLQSNHAAQDILTDADGLTTVHGELRAATPALTTKLQTLLNAAMRTRNGEALGGEATMALPRPSGRRPLTLLIAALPSASPLPASTEACAAIFISDPEQSHDSGTASRIRALFGLTVRESELVQLLASGLTLEEAAARLDLALETVRSRLKVIFQKTSTRRQAELVRLILTTVAGFR